MLKTLKFLFFLVVIGQIISCKSDPLESRAALQLIPSTAYSVTEIRTPELLRKADFANFQKMEVYQELINEVAKDSEFFAEIIKDPSKTGIDLEQSIYLFSSVPDETITNNFSCAIIPLVDKEMFSQIMSNANGNADLGSKNGMTYYKKNETIFAWNDEFAVIGIGTSRADLIPLAESILNKSHDNSLANNQNLLKTLSLDHDINSWTSSNPYAEISDAKMGAAFMGIDPDALKDNYIYSYLDFEDGVIQGTSTFDLQKALTKDFKLFFKDQVKTDFDKFLPQEDLSFAFSTALDVRGINQVLSERPQTKQLVDYGLKAYGMTMSDIAKIFPGDMALAFYNIGDGDIDPYGIFMMEIGDRSGLQQILEVGIEYDLIQKISEDHYSLDDEIADSFFKSFKRQSVHRNPEIRIKGDIMLISGNANILEGFSDGRLSMGSKLGKASRSLLQDHIFAGLINLDEIKIKDLDIDNPFGQINISADRKKSEFKLNFKDKNQNSLKQILGFINQVYQNQENKKGTTI